MYRYAARLLTLTGDYVNEFNKHHFHRAIKGHLLANWACLEAGSLLAIGKLSLQRNCALRVSDEL